MSIVDTDDRAFMILVGRPRREGYKARCDEAAEAIREASKEICFTENDKPMVQGHGDFLSRDMGYSIGIGHTVSVPASTFQRLLSTLAETREHHQF
jgi:hypothetical protein